MSTKQSKKQKQAVSNARLLSDIISTHLTKIQANRQNLILKQETLRNPTDLMKPSKLIASTYYPPVDKGQINWKSERGLRTERGNYPTQPRRHNM